MASRSQKWVVWTYKFIVVQWKRQVELQAKAGSQFFSEDPNVVSEQMINEVPMKRYGSIDEVIRPVIFLLSDDASYITGTDIKITGGI
jgi:NAD(P)-dependent dehydrogenase (short-subunit alcohol dehydrogenase family)